MKLKAPKGANYYKVLRQMHVAFKPELYFEIGTNRGKSLEHASCASIAVDPEFKLRREIMGKKPSLLMFSETSDDFFDHAEHSFNGKKVDLAFLDGMHLFEYLLRDFMNIEPYVAHGARVILHDCLPHTQNMAERDRSKTKTWAWTGDVWKLVPILREYRPDLKITLLDAAPTGLVMIEDMDPSSTVLKDNYDKIVADYMDRILTDNQADPTIATDQWTAMKDVAWYK